MHKKIKLVAADDDRYGLRGLITFLNNRKDFHLVQTFRNGRDLVDFFKTNTCDVAIIDLLLAEKDGVTALKEIGTLRPEVKKVILTCSDKTSNFTKCLLAGARGYVVKTDAAFWLVRAIKNATLDGYRAPVASPRVEFFSGSEHKLLELMGSRKDKDAICKVLDISPENFQKQTQNIRVKLGIEGLEELITYAQRGYQDE